MSRMFSFILTSVLVISAALANSWSEDVYPDRVVLKFHCRSVEQPQIRTKVLLELRQRGIEGQVTPLIRRPLIAALQRRYQQRQHSLRRQSYQFLQQLEGLHLLSFSMPYHLPSIMKILQSIPEVAFVESVPKRYLTVVPNDPLLAEQYYLNQIEALTAWDELGNYPDVDSVIVAVLDTGVDLEHEDLQEHIFRNYGEIGVDDQGRDKRSNGIDDDGNGFIDDWQGWDFYNNDNNPMPGNPHGTHVAGVIGAVVNNHIGIAGINPRVKILALKIGPDNPLAVTVGNGYEAMVYAAAMGARVINCSWGGPTRSRTEQEIINAVTEAGALVIAASGNLGIKQIFYPAGYRNVIAVGSVNKNDRRSYFSNYGYFIDVMAPGEQILSTVPNHQYQRQSGTSMAAPVASGVASLIALVHPEYTAPQIGAHLKATCDSIDYLEPNFTGFLGYGRVNARRALQRTPVLALQMEQYQLLDANRNDVIEAGETVQLHLTLRNMLDPLENARLEIHTDPRYIAIPETVTVTLGALGTLQQWSRVEPLQFAIPEDVPQNYLYTIELRFYEHRTPIGREYITFVVNPTYRTLAENDITVTVNDRGNLAYNDYPDNLQGEGFRYKNSPSILFEGALMVGVAYDRVSNVARSIDQLRQDRSFIPEQPLQKLSNTETNEVWIVSHYRDSQKEDEAGVSVSQRTIELLLPPLRNVVLLEYTVTNENAYSVDSLFTGLYFDWDIGLSGQGDLCLWDSEDLFGYVYNTRVDSLPHIGIVLLSDQPINFFAIDNDGPGGENPGVYDGFTRNEKWYMMTNGIARERSNITDVSAVIAGGPVHLQPGESEIFLFGIVAGNSQQHIRHTINQLREYLRNKGLDVQLPQPPLAKDLLAVVYPNPVLSDPVVTLELIAQDSQYVEVELFSYLGVAVQRLFSGQLLPKERKQISIVLPVHDLSNSQYFIRVRTPQGSHVLPVVLLQ